MKATDACKCLLDTSFDLLQTGQTFPALDNLMFGLWRIHRTSVTAEWEACTKLAAEDHPMTAFIRRSPYVRRAYEKPRGYAGDAQTLDYIYGYERLSPETDESLFELHRWFEEATTGWHSVRERRNILAQLVDQAADRTPGARVLSIACGHLREAAKSRRLAEGLVGEYIALDQDAQSLEFIGSKTNGFPIRTVEATVRSILRGNTTFSDLDLVYAAGLFDYLPTSVATRLTSLMFDMLRPGGVLFIPNFAPNFPEIGFAEMMMDWRLIYRDEADMANLTAEIHDVEVGRKDITRDSKKNLVFLTMYRR